MYWIIYFNPFVLSILSEMMLFWDIIVIVLLIRPKVLFFFFALKFYFIKSKILFPILYS